MKTHVWLGWIVMALLALVSSCTVLADVDYRAPPDEPDSLDGLRDGSGGAAGAAGSGG